MSTGVCVPEDFDPAPIREAIDATLDPPLFWHSDLEAAGAAAAAQRPDLMLFGAGRVDAAALDWVLALRESSEATQVILICRRTRDGEVRRLLDVGVRALVALDEVGTALRPVIEAVRAGQITVPGARRGELRKRVLTAREKQILGLVVMGMTNGEIAAKLFLSESTVKSHLSSAFAKLGVSSRSEAANVILDPRTGAGLGILTISSS